MLLFPRQLAKQPFLTRFVRTVPYFNKGEWKLPSKTSQQDTPEPNGAPATGTAGTPNVEAQAINVPKNWRKLKLPQWKKQMFALREKFPEGWNPQKRLSREKMAEIQEIKKAFPELTTKDLGKRYRVSPESIRRILKNRWTPDDKEKKQLQQRWHRRGERIKGSKDSAQGSAKDPAKDRAKDRANNPRSKKPSALSS